MSTRSLLTGTGVLLGFAVAFAAGLRIGVTVGAEEFAKMDSSARASVLTSELRALRAGSVAQIIEAKEIEVDGSVVSAIEFQNSGMPWLFWPRDGAWNHARSLGYVAEYRKQYPPVIPKLAPTVEKPDPGGLRSFAKEVEGSTLVLIERYGK
ncbi:hypothetical protein [Polaromonas sp. JS666]|uniref:hypothetical protein n=1 Tax=Polaromonas sp. (strain JS666 / ATCC BAA-500) TaxID=296591 RepID=UPI00005326BC|nr:hypothetical protein [Polaromonas sp. JS666]